MQPTHLYEFHGLQAVPGWLYAVSDQKTTQEVPCFFGTSGGVAVMADRSVVIWPSADRLPEEYIFTFGATSTAASAGHPAEDDLLRVLTSESIARDLLGDAVDGPFLSMPEADPRPGS